MTKETNENKIKNFFSLFYSYDNCNSSNNSLVLKYKKICVCAVLIHIGIHKQREKNVCSWRLCGENFIHKDTECEGVECAKKKSKKGVSNRNLLDKFSHDFSHTEKNERESLDQWKRANFKRVNFIVEKCARHTWRNFFKGTRQSTILPNQHANSSLFLAFIFSALFALISSLTNTLTFTSTCMKSCVRTK